MNLCISEDFHRLRVSHGRKIRNREVQVPKLVKRKEHPKEDSPDDRKVRIGTIIDKMVGD